MSKPTASQPQAPADDDIQNPKFAASALDFLLIELVPTIQRITEQALAREQKVIDEYRRSKIFNGGNATTTAEGAAAGEEQESEKTMTSLGFPVVTPSTREAMQSRLDAMGYRVGQGLVER